MQDTTRWTYDVSKGLVTGKTYADDTEDAFTYTSENLLQSVTNPDGSSYGYDYGERRDLERIVSADPSCRYGFVNDDGGRIAALSNGEFRWLLRLETISTAGGLVTIEYVWGKDISGSLGGAAGIGGLLYTKINGAIYVPQYDAYGNIIGYCDAAGNIVASYTYDSFGRTIAQSGALADVFAFRYSTKYFDRETGFYYYGKRYYSPALRRWLTRDPIGEVGGVNLYGFCENRPIHFHDEIGCIAVKYVAWQDNGWFVKLFSGEAMSLIEVSSAEEIPIVIKTLNLNGAFSVAPSFVNDCEMQVLLQVVLSDQLKDKPQRGERFSVKPHDNNGGGGVSFSLLGGRSTYGAIKAHELGHAQAFFESTIKNFENKAAAYLSKNRLSEKEKLKVVSLFHEAYNEDISESGRRASLRAKFWYEGNGFNIIDKEDHYEAVFR